MEPRKHSHPLRVVKTSDCNEFQKAPAERLATGSGAYYNHILSYAHRIRSTRDAEEIIRILDEALQETRGLHAIDELAVARRQVAAAERKISALKSELEEVSELLREDPLTGALNRRGLDEAFNRESARADRRGTPVCVVLLDLDNFKILNDTHGHQAGDSALIELTRTAIATLRPNDVVARIGGEEFVLLLPDTDLESAKAATNRLATTLAENRMRTSFSAGIALRNPEEALRPMLARADHALYVAKQGGKNRAEIAAQ